MQRRLPENPETTLQAISKSVRPREDLGPLETTIYASVVMARHSDDPRTSAATWLKAVNAYPPYERCIHARNAIDFLPPGNALSECAAQVILENIHAIPAS